MVCSASARGKIEACPVFDKERWHCSRRERFAAPADVHRRRTDARSTDVCAQGEIAH
jgi:hypothetical protein